MNNAVIQSLVSKEIIKKQYEGEYRLKRPLVITIRKKVIDQLKALYRTDYEEGGLLEAVAVGKGAIVIDAFHPVKNAATVGYSYAPGSVAWQNVVSGILGRGNLPFALHTHPLSLGIESYDTKRATFYLKPSPADRSISREGITDYLNFPEAIFTVDNRLDNGFGINFFTGFIFPATNQAISTSQWLVAGAGLLASIFFKSKEVLATAMVVFLFDFFRRPNYELLGNGDVKISLTA